MVDQSPKEQALAVLRNAKQEIAKLPYFGENLNLIEKLTVLEESLYPLLALQKTEINWDELYPKDEDEFIDGRETPWNG